MKQISRRDFLKCIGAASLLYTAHGYCVLPAAYASDTIRGTIFKGDAPKTPWKWSIEGFYYQKIGQNVQCLVCPNTCVLSPGDRSVCRSKVNIDGTLYSLTYGNPCAVHIDPIEKKPLYHFLPQTKVFSVATTGCNFRCLNCQNWEISQRKPEEVRHSELFPQDVVNTAKGGNISSIAYTYSEATTYYEYMFHTAQLAREAGIKNVWVSNGYINPGPLKNLSKYLDAASINLKSYDDTLYKKLNGGRLEPVLKTLKFLKDSGVWFEIITLIVPGYVDKPDMVKRMCNWILHELGPDYPLHFSRFFPHYKLDRLPPTPINTLEASRRIALSEGIRYVYIGNVPGHHAAHTYCHYCHKRIIKRTGYFFDEIHIENNRCHFCKTVIPGKWY
ncbi:MAG: AmmeMemoRadiSam system radical SAM enzyme [Thermodesulfobacteriota bacterium]|nr:AmmeMemoRadiSam system radical SAM enzyme [Thermodesulfobacteriota bacterium]